MDTQLFLPGSPLWHDQQARNRAEVERAHQDALDERARRRKAAEDERNRQAKLARMGPQSRAVAGAKRAEDRIALLTRIEQTKREIGTAHDVGSVRAVAVARMVDQQCGGCAQSGTYWPGRFLVERGIDKTMVYVPVVCQECGHRGEITAEVL